MRRLSRIAPGIALFYVCEGHGPELEVINTCEETSIDSQRCECPPCQSICCGELLEPHASTWCSLLCKDPGG